MYIIRLTENQFIISLKVKEFAHYEFLYKCVETYIKGRNVENIYDVYKLYEDAASGTANKNQASGGQKGARDSRVSIVSYYVDGVEVEGDDENAIEVTYCNTNFA